ncbi:DUF5675 family protein [Zhouia spongiae]|uniref:DUF5675 family protein n=1 Tax=Zhouia spongiae TaxID=2202721 RepID=A0ABY3YJ80_9FLAO|nr:DUF5675 family protein [Zhouia spongiae]UNY97906.1 DUF5675 family protein [Zhouia spongiae]
MELILLRSHFKEGTQGALYFNGNFVCFMIELPWKDNIRNISCIPDGLYPLQLRTTHRFGPHLQVCNVPDRDAILIHPANDALEELKGCLAPVTQMTGIARGVFSRIALDRLLLYYERSRKFKDSLFLRIVSKDFSTIPLYS